MELELIETDPCPTCDLKLVRVCALPCSKRSSFDISVAQARLTLHQVVQMFDNAFDSEATSVYDDIIEELRKASGE